MRTASCVDGIYHSLLYTGDAALAVPLFYLTPTIVIDRFDFLWYDIA